MKLTRLEIKRADSWADAPSGALVGLVELTGLTGKQAITLSPGAINRLIKVIVDEVSETAKSNANAVKQGLVSAQDENILLEHDGSIQVGE